MWLLLTLGCRVVDAPDTIEELMIFGFVNHTQDDQSYPSAFVSGLLPLAKENQEDLEKGYRVDCITEEDLAAAGANAEGNAEVTGVATQTHFESGFSEVVDILSSPDPGAVFTAVEEFSLNDATDRDCFLSGTCEFYDYNAHRKLNLGVLGKVTQDFSGSFRQLQVEDIGTVALWRTVAPKEAETEGAVTVHQQYSLDLFVAAEDGGTDRFSAIWLDAELAGSPLSDSLMITTSVKQLNDAAGDVDAFLAD